MSGEQRTAVHIVWTINSSWAAWFIVFSHNACCLWFLRHLLLFSTGSSVSKYFVVDNGNWQTHFFGAFVLIAALLDYNWRALSLVHRWLLPWIKIFVRESTFVYTMFPAVAPRHLFVPNSIDRWAAFRSILWLTMALDKHFGGLLCRQCSNRPLNLVYRRRLSGEIFVPGKQQQAMNNASKTTVNNGLFMDSNSRCFPEQ